MNINIELNPQEERGVFHKNINAAFPGWGDMAKYEWCFERSVSGLHNDTMILKDDSQTILAGSGITYRRLKTATNENLNIGIMTGSWTLPAARRKGCFTKIIEVSEELTYDKKANFLCGFLAGTNPSYGRLNAASRFMKPTAYMFCPTEIYTDTNHDKIKLVENPNDSLIQSIYDKNIQTLKAYTHFEYSLEEFKAQFVTRPGKIEIVELPHKNYAILEETNDVVKVQLLTWEDKTQLNTNIKSLVNWSLLERQKKLFYFSSLDEITTLCRNINFEIVPGFFHIIVTDKNKKEMMDDDITNVFGNFNANNGDKM